ncbi:UDP-glucose dehydrogenase family protein [Leucobacter sp. USHLN153]|uniref:UDP-glucose dehydrogenase family protein n=1 Tax=Leucobacter sp. USHLN153 TaxID=3081268 RepID=UPI00301A0D6E
MRISVIGCGYLGAVHAAAMASLGHDVIGIDIDPVRVNELAAGRAPFFEPGLPDLLKQGLTSGTLRFSTESAEASSACVHFLCVGTPSAADGSSAELSYLRQAVQALLPHLDAGDLVVGKSTVPVGTAADLETLLADSGASLAWNPEFLREGHAISDTLKPDRIVVGMSSRHSPGAAPPDVALRALYAKLLEAGTPLEITDLATAELAKGAANAFLSTKISFMNVMADIADAAGADVGALTRILGHDPRIGSRYLGAGLGYGGGCLPKDLRAFVSRAEQLGVGEEVELLRRVEATNEARRQSTVGRISALLDGSVAGKRIAVLGAAFKPDSDDVRDSPGLDIAERLHQLGADVVVTDPAALPNAQRRYPALDYLPSWRDAIAGSALILMATEWQEFVRINPRDASLLTDGRIVVDGRNSLNRALWTDAGWHYVGIGRR